MKLGPRQGKSWLEWVKDEKLKYIEKRMKSSKKLGGQQINMNIVNWVLIQLIVTNIYCAAHDYIWVNYAAQLPITKINATIAAASIPCEVRIGSCSITYNLLPLGWTSTPDGQVLLPLSDLTKSTSFFINATLTDIFDDKVEADLVVTIQNNILTVKDRAQFMASNGFDPKNSVARPLQQPSNLQPRTVNLQGFPSTDQLQALIKYGNIYNISSRLKEVSQKYAPCPDRLAYLNIIYAALRNKIAENQRNISAYRQQVASLSSKIAYMEAIKKQAQNKLLEDKSFRELQKSLINLNSTKNQLQYNFDRYENLSNSYLINLKNVSNSSYAKNNSQDQLEIAKLEDDLKELDKTIEEMIRKKGIVAEQIKEKKAKLKSRNLSEDESKQKDNQDSLMRIYESKYRQNSELALNLKIQLQTATQQLSSLASKYRIKTSEVGQLNKELEGLKAELKNKQSSTAMQVEQEQIDINEIFKLSADNMQNKIYLLSATQCGY